MLPRVNVFWFRRDLRLYDNAGLFYALRAGAPVLPVFIFDTGILDDLKPAGGPLFEDRRVEFILQSLTLMQDELKTLGSSLDVRYGNPVDIFSLLVQEYDISSVFTNNDYEPYAVTRDTQVRDFLKEKGIGFQSFKDQVIFERAEIVKQDGKPYTVFTPYSKKWKSQLSQFDTRSFPVEDHISNFYKQRARPMPSLHSMGFKAGDLGFPVKNGYKQVISHYHETRDIPSLQGTTRLSVHLRFGTISIRELVREASLLNEKFLNELIWREFYQMMLWHFPGITLSSFKPEYDKIEWRNDQQQFNAWCKGKTGYPIVDAGMRELNATGYMHNRVRMITASFLTKHLLIDWRWGEAYFAEKLLDYDLASNNGGWQWAAGSGADAAPYFRIFNPYLQAKKFDPDNKYIRRWVPEFGEPNYPSPIVEHEIARKKCLTVFGQALRK